MVTAPSSALDVGEGMDAALREAVATIDSPDYQHENPAFSPLTTRDWVVMAALYVGIPVVLALVVGLP